MNWKERLEESKKELLGAESLYKGPGTTPRGKLQAYTVLSSQRCGLCGARLVPFFAVPGPYVCDDCTREFKATVADGQPLFRDLPKRHVTE